MLPLPISIITLIENLFNFNDSAYSSILIDYSIIGTSLDNNTILLLLNRLIQTINDKD